MKCSDLQFNLSLYADGLTSQTESDAVAQHLGSCPLCRAAHSDIMEIRSGLRSLERPVMSAAAVASLKRNVRSQSTDSWFDFSSDFREWFARRLMPFGVGVSASLLVGVTFLSMMYSGMLAPDRASTAMGGRGSIMLAANSNPYRDMLPLEISPGEYAQARMNFASESPSINPKGALIALTKSLVRGGMEDGEVVVVADVFSNGLAQIAEVVEPSSNRRAVSELQKALESDPAYAAFVPANLESRPDSVRVVLKFQSVDVSTRER